MTNRPEEPQPPIFAFDADGGMDIYESVEDLYGHVEPLLVEELMSAFDGLARPVKVSIIDDVSQIALATRSSNLRA